MLMPDGTGLWNPLETNKDNVVNAPQSTSIVVLNFLDVFPWNVAAIGLEQRDGYTAYVLYGADHDGNLVHDTYRVFFTMTVLRSSEFVKHAKEHWGYDVPAKALKPWSRVYMAITQAVLDSRDAVRELNDNA